jgi:uncharacterized protein (TIGR03083 family)
MDVADHIAALQEQGALMADAIDAGSADAAVPTCPEWVMRDLVLHLGAVHRWAGSFVGNAITEPDGVNFEELIGTPPDDAELGRWFQLGVDDLANILSGTSPDVECWTFLSATSPLAFWARRQAHETAIHRIDAELAAGQPVGAEPAAFAADGIDELLMLFVPRRRVKQPDFASRSLVVACDDADGMWRLTMGPEGVTTVVGGSAEGADCTVRGPASDLFHVLWNRRSTDGLELTGDSAVLSALLGRTQVRWS